MAFEGVQIGWGANSTAEVVAAARQSLLARASALHRAASAPSPQPEHRPVSLYTAPAKQVKLKKLLAIGGAAGLPGLYALSLAILICAGLIGVWKANVAFAPEMYDDAGMASAAKSFSGGKNYAVFDLNINIRRLREEHVARFTETPDVVLLGASHWQEAHAGLLRSERMYNGHVHRDYWEDLLGVVEVYVRNDRLPKRMIISIRDNEFTPIEKRKDFLWEPGIANYEQMAGRLGLETESAWRTYPWQRMKEKLSLSMLFTNVTRWYNAAERPHASRERHFKTLDALLPDGSILWSAEHQAVFTAERTLKEAKSFAGQRRNDPPQIDPNGVKAFDALLGFLNSKGVQVVLVHPPFNPQFYDAVQDGTYPAGLDKIRKVTRELAAKHGLRIIGDFDPRKVGCTADMYIDAEHSNPSCIRMIFKQYEAILPELKRNEMKAKS
jgi:hypothetical protein